MIVFSSPMIFRVKFNAIALIEMWRITEIYSMLSTTLNKSDRENTDQFNIFIIVLHCCIAFIAQKQPQYSYCGEKLAFL